MKSALEGERLLEAWKLLGMHGVPVEEKQGEVRMSNFENGKLENVPGKKCLDLAVEGNLN